MAPTIDSGPQPLDWRVYVGDANLESFEFLLDGQPWDLTLAVITAQARRTAQDPVVAVEATVTAVNAGGGLYTVGWDGEEIRALLGDEDTWTGVWDLQVLPSGQPLPKTLLRGAWIATHDVTRVGP